MARASASRSSARSSSPSIITSAAARNISASLRSTRAACSRGRRSAAAGTTVAATSATAPPMSASVQRVKAPTRADDQGRHHDRLHGRLGDHELPAVEQERDRHRQRHHERDLPPARAEPDHQQVTEQHAERDPDGHLRDPTQPLAVRRAEADDRRDRGEERRRVAEQVAWRSARPRRPRGRTGRSRRTSIAVARPGCPATYGCATRPGRADRAGWPPWPRSCQSVSPCGPRSHHARIRPRRGGSPAW